MVSIPGDHRPARARHPDAIVLEPGVQLAATTPIVIPMRATLRVKPYFATHDP
jgi:hypothetical protein